MLAVTSAVPELSTHAVELSLGVLVVLVLVNLRGVRESGFVFALPTYGFIIAIGATIVVGFVRGMLLGWPTAHVPDPAHAGLAAGVGDHRAPACLRVGLQRPYGRRGDLERRHGVPAPAGAQRREHARCRWA